MRHISRYISLLVSHISLLMGYTDNSMLSVVMHVCLNLQLLKQFYSVIHVLASVFYFNKKIFVNPVFCVSSVRAISDVCFFLNMKYAVSLYSVCCMAYVTSYELRRC